jgi:hypothetical protein
MAVLIRAARASAAGATGGTTVSTTTWQANTPGVWEAVGVVIVIALSIAAVLLSLWRRSTKSTGDQAGQGGAAGPQSEAAPPRGGLLTGYDYRVSTSKSMAYIWTAVVAWMVVTEALVVLFGDPVKIVTANGQTTMTTPGFGEWMRHVLDDATSRNLYLIFLGGPYAAAILAKVTVTTRVSNGTLQKTDGDKKKKHPSDAVLNDAGAVDLVDFQYVLFNLIVALAAVGAFISDVGGGLPTLADFLAILTGGSALTYTVNKGVTSNQPTLTAIYPQTARVGDRVTVYGNNLAAVSSNPTDVPTVTVAGVTATVVAGTAMSDSLTFVVPAPAAGTAWSPSDRQRVLVTTVAGLNAPLDNQLQVVADQPTALRLDPATIAIAAAADYANIPITLYGDFLASPQGAGDPPTSAQITIAQSGAGTTETVNATVGGDGQLTLTLPTDLPGPTAVAAGGVAIAVTQVRGYALAPPSPLVTVELLQAPKLEPQTITVNGDPHSDVTGTSTLRGQYLGDAPPAASGTPAGVPKPPQPLQIRLTDPHGNDLPLIAAQQPAGDTQVAFALSGIQAPDAGATDTYALTLERGELSSAEHATLEVHGNP